MTTETTGTPSLRERAFAALAEEKRQAVEQERQRQAEKREKNRLAWLEEWVNLRGRLVAILGEDPGEQEPEEAAIQPDGYGHRSPAVELEGVVLQLDPNTKRHLLAYHRCSTCGKTWLKIGEIGTLGAFARAVRIAERGGGCDSCFDKERVEQERAYREQRIQEEAEAARELAAQRAAAQAQGEAAMDEQEREAAQRAAEPTPDERFLTALREWVRGTVGGPFEY